MRVSGNGANVSDTSRHLGNTGTSNNKGTADTMSAGANVGVSAILLGGAAATSGGAMGNGALGMGNDVFGLGNSSVSDESRAGFERMMNKQASEHNSLLDSVFALFGGGKEYKQFLAPTPYSQKDIEKAKKEDKEEQEQPNNQSSGFGSTTQANGLNTKGNMSGTGTMSQPEGSGGMTSSGAGEDEGTAVTNKPTTKAKEASSTSKPKPVSKPDQVKVVSHTDPAVLAAIDNSSFSSPEQLKKWDALVDPSLSPAKRIAQEKALNRPYAAAKLALEGGDAGAKAMAYFKANPAVFRAMETGSDSGDNHHLQADGRYCDHDLKVFANTMSDQLDGANAQIADYRKKNPSASNESLSLVRSAALMYANDPILQAAAKNKAVGAVDQQNTGLAQMGDFKALSDPENNPDLSPEVAQNARLWSKPGMFHILDDDNLDGKDLARHGGDKKISAQDFSSFISRVAPSSSGDFASFISYVAMLNAVEKVDISHLNHDVFDHPNKYTGAQKAAVLIKLKDTLKYVHAGKGIRHTDKTEEDLSNKINQLQQDKSVNDFFDKSEGSNVNDILDESPDLLKSEKEHLKNDVLSGKSLQKSLASHPNSPFDAAQSLGDIQSELQLNEELTGKKEDVSDIVAHNPALEKQLRQAASQVENGHSLTELVKKNKDGSLDNAVNAYWENYTQLDNALSKTKGGGLKTPSSETLQNAVKAGGVDPSELNNLSNAAIQGLMLGVGAYGNGQMMGSSVKQRLKQEVENEVRDKAIEKGAKLAVKQGAKFAARMGLDTAGRAVGATAGEVAGEAVAGEVAGEAAGEATGLAAAGSIEAATGPIGWAVGAVMGIGMGIGSLVGFLKHRAEQRRERHDFDHTVNPTLDQFGITKPS